MLNKPFAEVPDAIGLGYHFTQKGMRRTFNDLARAANVEAIVTRAPQSLDCSGGKGACAKENLYGPVQGAA